MTHILNYIKKNKLLWPILLVGFVLHMAMIVLNGLHLCYQAKCGMYMFGIHGYDMVWHMALSAASFNSWPFQNPIFSGSHLSGYNYLMDLFGFFFIKLGLPTVFVYFKLFPVLWFALFTFSLMRFGLLLSKNPKFIGLLLFMSYFTGSFAYLLSWWHHGSLFESSGLVAMQALHSLANMQFAFSLIAVLEVLIIIKKDVLKLREVLLLALFVFLTVGLKFYGGIITSFLVGVYILTKLFPLNKQSLKVVGYGLFIILVFVASIIIFYDPFNSTKTGAIFSFDPLATVHPMIERQDLVLLPNLANMRYTLQGHVGPRLILIETITISLFLFFNYGIRLLGVGYILFKSAIRKVEKWEVIALLTIVFATLLNMLLVQKGEWWNTVQFLYYGLFLSTIFTAQFLFALLQKKKTILTVLAFVIILISLPINIDLIYQFDSPKAMVYITQKEFDGLMFLKKQPKGTIFLPLYDEHVTGQFTFPYPMWANFGSAYVPAFTDKVVYYSNPSQLSLMGVQYESRFKEIKKENCEIDKNFDYVYIVKAYRMDKYFRKCIQNSGDFKQIFANDAVWIYAKNTH